MLEARGATNAGWRSERAHPSARKSTRWALACAALLVSCSSSGSGGKGWRDAGSDLTPEQRSLCEHTVDKFCELGCSCSAEAPSCVTGNSAPFSSGVVRLTWSDAADCAAAYRREWCEPGDQAPSSIEGCASAVDALACAEGGVTRPDACNPAPMGSGANACSSDDQCPESHCAKAQRAVGSITNLEPVEAGQCATECRTNGDVHVFCGSACSPGAGEYCRPGWVCVGATGVGTGASTCQCSRDDTRPERSAEICDGKDNDCNGVVDDAAAADAHCSQNVRAGFGCQDGSCQLCPARCDGSCVDTDLDAKYCGGCGNACAEGQTCAGGACVDAHAVVQGRSPIERMQAFRGDVYFTERYEYGLFRCPAEGCAPSPLRLTADEAIELVSMPAGDETAVDPSFAFVQVFQQGSEVGNRLKTCPVSGCGAAPRELGDLPLQASTLAVRGDRAFLGVVEGDADPGVYTCLGTGCTDPPEQLNGELSAGQEPTFATDATHLYFTMPPRIGVFRCPLGGPCDTASALFESGYRTGLVGVDGRYVYVEHQTSSSERGVARCPVAGCTAPEKIFDVPLSATVYHGQLFAVRSGVYGHVVYQCALDDCSAPKRLWQATDKAVTLQGIAATEGVLYLNLRGEDPSTGGMIWAIPR
jgi:hypothetical protein